MIEQLSLDLKELEEVNQLDLIDDDKEPESDLIYKNRLKNLIKSIALDDEFTGVQLSKKGLERIQQNSKYLITMLVLEILDELRKNTRKQIRSTDVDSALDRVLSNASAIQIATDMLSNDIDKLRKLNNNAVVSRANKFINDNERI